mmetsp:Transcript_8739/g.16551  ORF Transcript_8739/g.16551 Transcript_8739/m.16551 type:complete len:94 (+) Transcript_8739:1112-1393(+)
MRNSFLQIEKCCRSEMSSVRNPSRTWTRWSQTLATEASPRERENSAMGDSLDSAMIFVHVILAMKFGRWSAARCMCGARNILAYFSVVLAAAA